MLQDRYDVFQQVGVPVSPVFLIMNLHVAFAGRQELPRIALIDPLSSYWSIVVNKYYNSEFIHSTVPGALKHYDLPDLAAILAPRKLLMAGITDVRGDLFNDGEVLNFGRNFFNGDFFKSVEVGYVPSMAERYFKKISVAYWHSDSYVNPSGTDISSGQGLAISGHWFFKERFIPWVRFAFSNGNGENAFYKKDVQIGHGLRFRTHDILGAGFSWSETNIPNAKDQMTIEVYYRFNVTEHFELTADYQLIFHPTFNPDRSSLSYWGMRGRITLYYMSQLLDHIRHMDAEHNETLKKYGVLREELEAINQEQNQIREEVSGNLLICI